MVDLVYENFITMNKSNHFSGQPILGQILNLIPVSIIKEGSRKYHTDKYYKKFMTQDHLVTMLYSILSKCNSIREVVTGIMACDKKLYHLGVNYFPKRSTLSEANCHRDSRVFEYIYTNLYKMYGPSLADSGLKKWESKLYIFDSTTISLFQEILRNAGRSPMNGKRKGGIKAHTLIRAQEDVPCLVRFTSAAAHDTPFIHQVNLSKGSIAVFDKGYNDYAVYQQWNEQGITFVTRMRTSAVYEQINKLDVSASQFFKGVVKDQHIVLGHNHNKKSIKINARLITYIDKETQKEFQFLTNNFTLAPATIADIYKRRWQIESLFKRIKQNYPLRNFLGDNENAIKIQIWSALIADLLLKYINKQIKTKKWAFANLVSMVRLHLMNYINIYRFLKNPEGELNKFTERNKDTSLSLFPT